MQSFVAGCFFSHSVSRMQNVYYDSAESAVGSRTLHLNKVFLNSAKESSQPLADEIDLRGIKGK